MSALRNRHDRAQGAGGRVASPGPLRPTGSLRAAVPGSSARFWALVDRAEEPSACWPWVGYVDQNGYGVVVRRERRIAAHRIAYELTRGPIPEELQLDHLCRNRACCNPAHLEAVDGRTNTVRGIGPTAQNAVKTHCVAGHEFTQRSTRTNRYGGRVCRTCVAINSRRYRSGRRAVAAPTGA